jgi:hypothetical protein
MLMLLSGLFAQEVDDSLPDAIKQFARAWNAKSFQIVEPYISSSFEISGVPKDYTKQALERVFTQIPHKIDKISLISSDQTKMGTRYTVLVERPDSSREIDFVIWKDGKIVSTTLFQASVKSVTKAKMETAAIYKSVPFTLFDRMIFVPGEINGKPVDFLLDSGAPIFVLNSKYNRPDNTVTLSSSQGVGGSIQNVGTMNIQTLSWGGGEYKDFDAISMDLSHLEDKLGRPFAGLISQAELEPYETIIDYQNETIYLYALDEQGDRVEKEAPHKHKSQIPFELKGHIPVIPARIGKVDLSFGLDTGAQSNLLDRSHYDSVKKLVRSTEVDTVMGADANAVEAISGTVKSTTIARKNYNKMKYVFSDISHLNDAYKIQISGLLGYPFLSQKMFGINYRKQELKLY